MTEQLKPRPTLEKLAYRVDEAAEVTGLSKATLYRLVEKGELHTIKVGARTLIRKSEIDSYFDRLESAA